MLANIIKNAALLFVIGLAVAVTAPLVINALAAVFPTLVADVVLTHATTSAAGALWTGTIFGLFGGFHAALGPVWNTLFGKTETSGSAKVEAHDAGKDVHVHNVQIVADLDVAKAANFAHRIEGHRRQLQPGRVT